MKFEVVERNVSSDSIMHVGIPYWCLWLLYSSHSNWHSQHDMASTLTEYLDSQQELENEAALALPYSFSHCTYSRGHIRQAVYLCITCNARRGICSSCSIACHTDHEQLELFPKRKFRCDCPTTALTYSCSLHKHPEALNEENEYGQNFDGKFCRCGRPYDAKSERETMIQCLSCEVRSYILQPRSSLTCVSGLVSRILSELAYSSPIPPSVSRGRGGREWCCTGGSRCRFPLGCVLFRLTSPIDHS